jgi:maleate isomerase
MGPYGRRATIGLIVPPRTNETVLYEMMQVVPEGVSWCVSTLGLREHQPEEYARALENVPLCTQELVARRVSAIAYSGFPPVTAQGPRFHEELADRMRQVAGSIPVTTDLAACMAAMHELGIRRVTIISNYQQVMIERLARALDLAGIQVAHAKGIHLSLAEQITNATFDTAYDLAAEAFAEQPNTDGFLMACPQWPINRNINRIEAATDKPVVGQLQAIAWWALRSLGIHDPLPIGGQLFARHAATASSSSGAAVPARSAS